MRLDINKEFAKLQFTTKKRVNTYRKLASLLNNNVNITDAFTHLYKQASKNGKKANEGVAIIYKDILSKLDNGEKVGSAMTNWVSNGEAMMIMAGEDAGDLDTMLNRVADNIEKKSEMISSLYGLIYPLFLFGMTCGFLVFFGFKIVPEFIKVLPTEKWTGLAKSLYVMSNFVKDYGLLVLISVLSLITLCIGTLPFWTSGLRVLFDKLPPWSLYRMMVGGDFLVSLNSLLSAGTRLEDSLKKLKLNAKPWLRQRLDSVSYHIANGHKLGTSMEKSGHKFPSQAIIDDLVIYENLSDMNRTIGIIAKQWLDEGVVAIRKQVSILNIVFTILMGLVAFWLVAGVFSIQQLITENVGSY